MPVDQMQHDGRRLEKHQVAVDQHRDAPVRVEPKVIGALLRILGSVDKAQLEGRADLAQHHVRQEAGVSRIIIERVHRGASFRRRALRILGLNDYRLGATKWPDDGSGLTKVDK